MTTMDIFEGDAFTIIELTRALENIPFKPAILSGTSLVSPRGVRSRTVVIESRDGTLSLIPFDALFRRAVWFTTRIAAGNICPFDTPSVWPKLALSHRSAVSVTHTTMLSLKP